MASVKPKFDAREWYLKLKEDSRFSPQKKNVDGKIVFVVNSGFVANYSALETNIQKRQVRAFLSKNFKNPGYKYPEFSRMNDSQLKVFMEAQEAYYGRTIVKETTAKRKLKALPDVPENNISRRSRGMAMEADVLDDDCKAYKILNGLLEGMFDELNTSHKLSIDVSITREQQKLIRGIKSCMDLKPERGFYEPILVFIKEKLPGVELSAPFLKLLRSSPPELTLKKVKSFVGSLQRGTKVLFKLKAGHKGGSMRVKTKKINKKKVFSKKNKKH